MLDVLALFFGTALFVWTAFVSVWAILYLFGQYLYIENNILPNLCIYQDNRSLFVTIVNI
mgnify:FL=1